MHLNLYVCEIYAGDYRQIVEDKGFDFVTIRPFNCLCHDRKKRGVVGQQMAADTGPKLIITSRACLVAQMPERDDANTTVLVGSHCFHDYVNEKFIDYIIAKGGYIITGGWLLNWEKWLFLGGFNQTTARQFYGETCTELVLLDTGNDPGIESRLAALADYIQLPYRMIYVGMDSLTLYLSQVINDWRQVQAGPSEKSLQLDELKKQGAEYAAVLHIIEAITGYTKKRDIIAKIKELFLFIFGAGRVRFLEAGDDDYFDSYLAAEFDDIDDEFKIDADRHYLVVKLSRYGETFGALEIGDFQRPEKINDYANFALSIARVSALAISNSVQYELLERSRDEVAYISYHDALTGLYNRNYFNQYTSRNEIQPGTCAFVCDIDGLKRVNDDYGHASGDELIRGIGRVLKKAFRESDLVARVGGDEFYIIVPNCQFNTAQTLKQRIAAIIDKHNHDRADPILKLSLSVGYCHGDEVGGSLTWEELFHQADQRMYTEKAAKKSLPD
ncbi:MAG: hypothetical protein CVU99_01915 [Firmicutes bacterium HGW-Firmicutes-4]|jgi:diguanylate cyclase (GGDEF)-like protein|nr:MAG: hypothetical protein CVU99_01915 [Firmicutes bacterium HGW-Firmicutes-4]